MYKVDIIERFKIHKTIIIYEAIMMNIFHSKRKNYDKKPAINIPKKKSIICQYLLLKYLRNICSFTRIYFIFHQIVKMFCLQNYSTHPLGVFFIKKKFLIYLQLLIQEFRLYKYYKKFITISFMTISNQLRFLWKNGKRKSYK